MLSPQMVGNAHTLSTTFINPYTLGIIVAPNGPLNHRNLRNSIHGATQRKLYILLYYME